VGSWGSLVILRRSGRRDLSSNLSDPTTLLYKRGDELETKAGDKNHATKGFPFGYTRFEKARIIGARSLQIAMGAPVLIKTGKTDPIEIAIEEYNMGVIPITVRRRKDRFVWLEKKSLF